MRRRTAHVLTATALTAVAFAGPVAGAVAAADLGMVGFAPGDFATLEVWPKSAAPGATVTVNTTACGPGSHADGDATTVGGGRFKLVPGTHKEVVVGQFQVARGTRPGTYGIGATCANGKFATGDLVVTERGPQGHVNTGVGGGTTTTTDPAKIAAGAAVLAATAVGGTWLLRRRASGTRS
ncbi:hypothetical protein ADK53_34670 [Streptomyces sp. WM6373]|uniref:hypothetical protein n=1 Tax=Streptomyces TaxID=1883 RepID=UPI0006B030BD|nr:MULTISPECIES: hypothetical protein [unclassified Streptomyces]KOU28384.1 hypothetical protein ADK53_34670 [Streptomyces sp. WM6373]KOU68549.1 hypothetical protein ADK96_10335 [Streptomyces sp. IGB124]KOU69525.1 hypothetical protein ADK61_37335 [Streptomyces sp. XY66]KOU81546.1 hypothetical protein ADK93_31020 [Streptomyces sp. XY58]KOV04656.1 hypothetical protein ADK89_22615 [Streptomyces sp. XY37]